MVCCAEIIYHLQKIFKTPLRYEKQRFTFYNQERFIYKFHFMSDMIRLCLNCKYFGFGMKLLC
jgi:hypothetical protein